MSPIGMRKTEREIRRRVDSGSWPLYLFMLFGSLTSSVVQLVTGEAPPSVATQSPPWFDPVYLFGQPLGAILATAALLVVRPLVASLHIERIGCIIIFTVATGYFLSVALNNGSIPTTQGTWFTWVFGLYCAYRVREIGKLFRDSRKGRSGEH